MKTNSDLVLRCFLAFWLFSPFFRNVVKSSCFQTLSMEPNPQYSGMTATSGMKSTKTVPNSGECTSFCVQRREKASIIYDPDTGKCSCSNLPLSMLELSPQPGAVAYGTEEPTSDMVVAWIASILGESSHFSSFFGNYVSTKMIGPANYYPSYGNNDKAWCPKYRTSNQWVEFAISESIYITEVHIYETFYAGGVETLSIRDPNSNWLPLWQTPGLEILTYSRIFSPSFIESVTWCHGMQLAAMDLACLINFVLPMDANSTKHDPFLELPVLSNKTIANTSFYLCE